MSDTNTYTYSLTEKELFSALWAVRRRASLARLIVQTVLLFAVGGLLLFDRRFLLGGALALLGIVQWAAPAAAFWLEAKTQVQAGTKITLTLSENAVGGRDWSVPLSEGALTRKGDLLLISADKDQTVALPRRVLPEAEWERLTAYC